MNLADAFPTTVDEESEGLRLDQFLSRRFTQISRSRWVKLIEEGLFTVNGRGASASQRLALGQSVACLNPAQIGAPEIPLNPEVVFKGEAPEVLFEDQDLLVINKPAGLGVHPGAGLPLEESLVAWLLQEKKLESVDTDELVHWDEDVVEQSRPGIVHRLDRRTSGALVIAKTPQVHQNLAKQFSDRTAGRRYFAVVEGTTKSLLVKRPRRIEELLVRSPCPIALRLSEAGASSFASFLERDPSQRTRFRVSNGEGKRAVTHFTEISANKHYSVVELKLETGRTHQIRIHLSTLGFPILGDTLYGGRPHERVLLHAHLLSFVHPRTHKKIEVAASWPQKELDWFLREGLELGTKSEIWQQLATSRSIG